MGNGFKESLSMITPCLNGKENPREETWEMFSKACSS